MKAIVTAAVLAAALATAASAAAPTLTLTASATSVVYGKPVTVSGVLAPAKPNQTVAVNGTACGTTRAAKITTAKTTAAGAYSAAVTPALATTYQSTFKNATSAAVSITVKPVLALSKTGATWTAKVTAGQALTGKAVLFQRYAKLRKRWVQVKRVLLATSAPGPAKPTTISSATFAAKVARGTRVRIAISTAQAAPCYVAATSPSLRG